MMGLSLACICSCATAPAPSTPVRVSSPDGRIGLEFWLNADGAPRYLVA
ncbi:MAG: hypothetical protein RMH97_01390 [Verrucomicrobiales bacterium]|nr:hypothetical protein [Verrucomicrobiales bacterium]